MKTSGLLILTTLCMLSLGTASSRASLIAYEGFDYTAAEDGLPGQNGGTGFSGAWSASPNNDIQSPGLTWGSLQVSGNYAFTDDNSFGPGSLRFLSTNQTGVVWVGGIVQSGNQGNGFMGLNLLNLGGNDQGAIALGQLYNGSKYAIYGESGVTQVSSTVDSGTLAFVAIQADLSAGTGTFYINPTGLGSGSAPTGSDYSSAFTFNAFTMSGIGLRGNANSSFDEIRVGTTWADISPVPEPSTVALTALGVGALLLHRRRSAARNRR